MNFTREPIIETIITPKDGYKIIVRSSKSTSQEEYSVDAVEVVSFGNSLFFRCLERPKCFLLPVSDYEVVEAKETRVVLKNIPLERTIKIGGGREAPKATRELPAEKAAEETEEGASKEEGAQPTEQPQEHRKRDRKRHRRRRGMEDRGEQKEFRPSETREPKKAEGGEATEDETVPVSSPTYTTRIPPPSTLISETISRYKDASFTEGYIPPKSVKTDSEEPTVENFVEENKERDIVHQELMESDIVTVVSYPEDLEDSQELFIIEKNVSSAETEEHHGKKEHDEHPLS